MTLDTAQIKEIIESNPCKEYIAKAKDMNKKLRMHMYGYGMADYMPKIPGFEQPALRELRVKYSKSNKDLFSRLTRPSFKIFTARGGSLYFNLSGSKDSQAAVIAADVTDGYSIRKWMQCFWLPHFLDDPNGLIFIEIDQNGKAYPTYKPITSIYAYKQAGNKLEYVVFNVDNEDKKRYKLNRDLQYYRVIDDMFDYMVTMRNGQVDYVDTYPNYFGEVPAMTCSDYVNPECEELKLSLYDSVIELADMYLLKGSIKVTADFRHGFPKYWEYGGDCSKCGGTGEVKGGETCDSCKGTGKELMIDPSRVKVLKYPEEKDDPTVAPYVAGYVEPSKDYHEITVEDLAGLSSLIYDTIWGNGDKQKEQGNAPTKTATEIVQSKEPMYDRLTEIAEYAEKRMKFILDKVITVMVNNGNTYDGVSVNLGRRYLLESADEIWKRYLDAKAGGASVSLLDELYVEFLEHKYGTDPVSMDIMLKQKDIEPFFHYTIKEIKEIGVSEEDYKAKLYYSEWLATMTDAELYNGDKFALKEKLYIFANEKNLPEPETEPVNK